jgi:hypothetical protein
LNTNNKSFRDLITETNLIDLGIKVPHSHGQIRHLLQI